MQSTIITTSILLSTILFSCAQVKPIAEEPVSQEKQAVVQPPQAQTPIDMAKCPAIEVPNVYTSRGDQVYDAFTVTTFCPLDNFKFTVYNRWGNKVFEATDQYFNWTGCNANGEALTAGSYFYMCTYEYKGIKHDSNGSIHIIN